MPKPMSIENEREPLGILSGHSVLNESSHRRLVFHASLQFSKMYFVPFLPLLLRFRGVKIQQISELLFNLYFPAPQPGRLQGASTL